MKILIEKEQQEELERERDKRLLNLVSYALNDGLRTFPVRHSKGLFKLVADYAEIATLLDNTTLVYEPPELQGYLNEP